tara:strand:+ start:856 stop:1128 length:273 start_codon:yes stop_codon:yes gene_type:complete
LSYGKENIDTQNKDAGNLPPNTHLGPFKDLCQKIQKDLLSDVKFVVLPFKLQGQIHNFFGLEKVLFKKIGQVKDLHRFIVFKLFGKIPAL